MSSLAKVCIILLPPLLLATYAAIWVATNEQSTYNQGNNDNGPWSVFFGHLVCYLFQFCSAAVCFKTLFGARHQYGIFQQYLRVGSLDGTGIVTKHRITHHSINCIETRQTHVLSYVYQVEDEEDGSMAVYEKSKQVVYHGTLCRGPVPLAAVTAEYRARNLQPPSLPVALALLTGQTSSSDRPPREPGSTPPPPTIPLKLLPGLPGSGYPTVLLQGEVQGYWVRTVVLTLMAASALVLLPYILYTIGDGDASWVIGVAILWSLGGGLWFARRSLQTWQENTLQSGLQEQHASSSPPLSSQPQQQPPMQVMLSEQPEKLLDQAEGDEENANFDLELGSHIT